MTPDRPPLDMITSTFEVVALKLNTSSGSTISSSLMRTVVHCLVSPGGKVSGVLNGLLSALAVAANKPREASGGE